VEQYQLASPLLGTGEYEQAAEHLENADAVYSARPEAKITLAQIYAALRQHDNALEKMDEIDVFFASEDMANADEATAADWRAQAEGFPLMRAQILADAGRFEEAAVAYRAVVADDPGNITAKQDLAAILMQTGETEQALVVYRDLASQPGLSSDGLTRIGLGLYQADEYAEAAGVLERAVDTSPTDRDAVEWWARALLADSAWAELPPVAERWLELDPMSGQGHAILAQGANQNGNTTLTAETVRRLEALEYSVDNLQMRRDPSGGADVSGSVTNRTLAQGSPVTLVFTFYRESGTSLGNVSQTVQVGGEGMSQVFQLQFSSAEQVGGYSYEVGG
jgi:tetratricopeptide (TPR) repeat protein